MNIRPATPDDLEAIRNCAAASYAMYIERIGREPAPMVADFATQISEGKVHVGVDESGEVCGYVVFYPRGDSVHLENVAISPDHQGKGYGGQLVAFVERQARERGIATVDLYTNEKMTENIALYPRLGYEEVGRWEEDGFNRVFYRKSVVRPA